MAPIKFIREGYTKPIVIPHMEGTYVEKADDLTGHVAALTVLFYRMRNKVDRAELAMDRLELRMAELEERAREDDITDESVERMRQYVAEAVAGEDCIDIDDPSYKYRHDK